MYRNLAFIKIFEDAPSDAAAPGEAEIEVFVSGLYDYVEIEQQGRYELPPAGSSSSWRGIAARRRAMIAPISARLRRFSAWFTREPLAPASTTDSTSVEPVPFPGARLSTCCARTTTERS